MFYPNRNKQLSLNGRRGMTRTIWPQREEGSEARDAALTNGRMGVVDVALGDMPRPPVGYEIYLY